MWTKTGNALLWIVGLTLCLIGGQADAQSQYTIKKGDTLGVLSKRFKVSVEEIVQANAGVVNPNKIYPGKVINLPANITPPSGYKGATLPKKAERVLPTANDDRPRPKVVQTNPQGLILLEGLTYRSVHEAWEVVLKDCEGEKCSGSVTLKNIGKTDIQGLAIGSSFWYYRTKMSHTCDVLPVGESCEITITYENGYTAGPPGIITIEAGDARVRPTMESVFFKDEVFWICPTSDLPQCGKAP